MERGTRRNARHTESQNLEFKEQQPNHTKGDSAVSIINNAFNNFHPLPYYVEEVSYHRRLTNLQVNYELCHGNRRTWLYPASSSLNEAFRGIRCIAVFSYVLNDIPNT